MGSGGVGRTVREDAALEVHVVVPGAGVLLGWQAAVIWVSFPPIAP